GPRPLQHRRVTDANGGRPGAIGPARRSLRALSGTSSVAFLGSRYATEGFPTGASRLGVRPRPAVGAAQQLVGLLVADDALPLGVPRQGAAQLHRQVGQDAAGRRDVALLDVGHRPDARSDGLDEVALVLPVGLGGVQLVVLLRAVLGVLVHDQGRARQR